MEERGMSRIRIIWATTHKSRKLILYVFCDLLFAISTTITLDHFKAAFHLYWQKQEFLTWPLEDSVKPLPSHYDVRPA
jgi:hypothetical protein